MCGRTALTASPEELREVFDLAEKPAVVARYNVAPSQPIYVVRRSQHGTGGRSLDALRWGLVPAWAKDPKIGQKLALARVESVTSKPAFRDAVRRHRCLVAVDAFYEWKHDGHGAHPFVVRRSDGKPFALAAIWDRWVSSEGEVVDTCAILTQPARPPVDAVHDRMPIVLDPKDWNAWLDPSIAPVEAIAPLLRPTAPSLTAYPVSSRVNDPRHDDAACMARSEPAQKDLFA
jgi:putative SOS response-associated peptidase YedK